MKYFDITFCELIKKDEELLNILFNLLLKENTAKMIEKILFIIIQIYNYCSKERNFGNVIKNRLSQCFHNLHPKEKRLFPNIIENLVDKINVFTSLINEPSKIQKKESLKTSFEELEFTVKFLFVTDNYPCFIRDFYKRNKKNKGRFNFIKKYYF